MAIFLRQSHNIKPPRWGSPADVQYAIRVNSEKIYDCNPDNDVLVMPLFWRLPPLDYSGYNNNGTNYGATFKDGSLSFDGGDYVTALDSSSLDITGALALSFWYKSSVLVGNDAGLISKSDDTQKYFAVIGLKVYEIGILDNVIYFQISNGTTASSASGSSSAWDEDGKLHHIVATWDGTTNANGIKIYVDKVETHQGTSAITSIQSISSVLDIGGYDQTWPFNGSINEIRISNVARTADQVSLFYDRPWDLYRPVSRPVWSIPVAGAIAPTSVLYGPLYGPLAGVI